MTTDAELSPNDELLAEIDAATRWERDQGSASERTGGRPMDAERLDGDLPDSELADFAPRDFADPDAAPECQPGFPSDAITEETIPTNVVEHVFNVPHVSSGLLSEESEASDTEMADEVVANGDEVPDEELSDEDLSDGESIDDELPDEDESLIERLRDWLTEVRAAADEAFDRSNEENADEADADAEFDAPGPGLLRLVEEFTALRHDVKLQAKSARGVQEQAGELLAGLTHAIEQFQSVSPREQQAAREAVRPMLEALVELDVAFDRGRLATEASRRRWLDADADLWRETIAAELKSLPWWQRLCLGSFNARLSHAVQAQAERACTATFDAQLDGYRLVQNRLRRLLAQHDVERMETVGQTADPNRVTIVEVADRDDVPAGTVLEELRPGYVWNGDVLRFAEVRVARGRREE